MFKVTMLLAEYATVANGKLTIVGGGFSVIGPAPQFYFIALKVEVPWDQATGPHKLRLELVTPDGQPVVVPSEEGEDEEVVVEGEFQALRPPGLKPGTSIEMPPLVVPVRPVPLDPGSRFEWRLSIDGESRDDWSLGFWTRPAASAQAI